MNIASKLAGMVPQSWIGGISHARWKHPWLRHLLEPVSRSFKNRDMTMQHGIGAGLRFNAGDSQPGYALGVSEPGVQKILESFVKPGMTVYDGGANVGFLSILLARLVGPGGRVVSFEPLPDNADRIESNARLNGFGHLVVRREALAGADGRSTFFLGEMSTRGLLQTVFIKPDQMERNSIEVSVRSLDSLAAEGVPAPDFVKLDVEGAEADTLRGGSDLLRRARPILMIELHDTNAAAAEALNDLDYRPVVLGCPGQSVAEAHWNAIVLAVPKEKADLVAALDAFNQRVKITR